MAAEARQSLWWGLGLIVVGVVGLVVVLGVGWTGGFSAGRPFGQADLQDGDFASLGEQIYRTGRGSDGTLIPRSGGFGGMMGVVACADCHGEDARGRDIQMMMFDGQAPDIRWSTLTESEGGRGRGRMSMPTSPMTRRVSPGR